MKIRRNMGKYTFYGHDLSYFSRKLESALVFFSADFDRVRVSLGIPSEEASKRTGTHINGLLNGLQSWNEVPDRAEVLIHVTSGIRAEGAHRFLKRLGFETVGGSYVKEYTLRGGPI